MKVKIDHTVETSDDQRVALADILDGKQSKRKASREEFKAFIWEKGESWPTELEDLWNYQFGNEEPDEEVDEEMLDALDDLLGEGSDADLEDLI